MIRFPSLIRRRGTLVLWTISSEREQDTTERKSRFSNAASWIPFKLKSRSDARAWSFGLGFCHNINESITSKEKQLLGREYRLARAENQDDRNSRLNLDLQEIKLKNEIVEEFRVLGSNFATMTMQASLQREASSQVVNIQWLSTKIKILKIAT